MRSNAGHERAAGRTAEAADAYREAAGRAEAVFANRDDRDVAIFRVQRSETARLVDRWEIVMVSVR